MALFPIWRQCFLVAFVSPIIKATNTFTTIFCCSEMSNISTPLDNVTKSLHKGVSAAGSEIQLGTIVTVYGYFQAETVL